MMLYAIMRTCTMMATAIGQLATPAIHGAFEQHRLIIAPTKYSALTQASSFAGAGLASCRVIRPFDVMVRRHDQVL